MSKFDTGNNPALTQTVLRECAEYLIMAGAEFRKPIGSDIVGTYAQLMRESGQHFYLVARRAQPYQVNQVPYVSTQKALIILASDNNYPIIMGLWLKEWTTPVFRVFDAYELRELYFKDMEDRTFENSRMGVLMINFEWDLGIDAKPGELTKTWFKMREAYSKRKNVGQVRLETMFGAEKKSMEFESCPECGASFGAGVFDVCPQCGRDLK